MNTRGLICATKRRPCLPPGDNVPSPSISTDPPRSSASRTTRAIRRVRVPLEGASITWMPCSPCKLRSAERRGVSTLQNRTAVWGRAGKFLSPEGRHFVRGEHSAVSRSEYCPVGRRPQLRISRTLWPNVSLIVLSSRSHVRARGILRKGSSGYQKLISHCN